MSQDISGDGRGREVTKKRRKGMSGRGDGKGKGLDVNKYKAAWEMAQVSRKIANRRLWARGRGCLEGI